MADKVALEQDFSEYESKENYMNNITDRATVTTLSLYMGVGIDGTVTLLIVDV
jgi:hypothetical protein